MTSFIQNHSLVFFREATGPVSNFQKFKVFENVDIYAGFINRKKYYVKICKTNAILGLKIECSFVS